jgi:predicted nucleic acid-binding Zn ribbon protein
MGIGSAGDPHCKRCGADLPSGRQTCPQCNYSPKERGLRISMGFLMAVVVLMTITMLLPGFGPLLVRLAGLAFLLSLVAFVLSFLATPYRLGSLFLRL